MLIRFYVENFSSFRTRQSFSMIPGKGTLKSNHKTTPVKGISVLKAAVVFGANASGKSNLIKAINFGKKLVLEDIKPGQKIDYSKFRLNELSIAGNSRLEYELQHNGKNYAYGFVFNKDGIVEEWLYEVTKKSDKKIFVRNGSSFDLSYLISINKRKEEKQFINFIAKGTPDNKLFLNEIRHRKVKENVTDISDITNVLDWFLNSLKVILPEDKYNVGLRFELKDDEKLLKSFEQFLEYFDTGIDGVCLEPISVEKVDIPDFLLKRISDDLLNANSEEKRAHINR